MPLLRRRARKVVKKKFGKRIKLRTVDKVWKDWVNGIMDEVIKYGKVQVDKNLSIEIVGQKTVDSRLFSTFVRGIGFKGRITKSANLHKGRDGVVYSIVLKDKNFREGILYFEPCAAIKKKVHLALVNTNHYYKIEK